MISINIMGGLGNELFMIFTTLAYGIQHNQKVIFPFQPNMGERHTYWHSFLSDLVIFTTKNRHNTLSDLDICHFQKYFEQGFHYTRLPNFNNANVVLNGYFQSYKYFEDVKDILFKLIHLSIKQQNIRAKFLELFMEEASHVVSSTPAEEATPVVSSTPVVSVSVHYRLGDYKSKRMYHPIMNYEYYENSLAYIVEHDPTLSRVLYFCENEDNEYVSVQISQLKNRFPSLEFIKVPDTVEDYEQMLIMSCCHHNVIANSSFSWWGAYFNQTRPDKIVCYPSVWFADYHYNCSDLCPNDWVKIQANPKHYTEPL